MKLISFLMLTLHCSLAYAQTPEHLENPEQNDKQLTVTFLGREIDLSTHLKVVPASWFTIDAQSGKVIGRKKDDNGKVFLVAGDLPTSNTKPLLLDSLPVISPFDIGTRNVWGHNYSTILKSFIILADVAKEERTNMYRVDSQTGEFHRMTDVGYIYSWAISPNGRFLAYSARSGMAEFTPGYVRVLDLQTLEDRVLFEDSKQWRTNWGMMSWNPDSSGFVVNLVKDENRNLKNLFYFPLNAEQNSPAHLFSGDEKRTLRQSENTWLSSTELVYGVEEEGFTKFFAVTLPPSKKSKTVKTRELPLKEKDFENFIINGKTSQIALIRKTPLRDSILVYNLDGKLAHETSSTDEIIIRDTFNDELFFVSTGLTNPGTVSKLNLTTQKTSVLATPNPKLADAVVHCVPEKISFPTFDGLSAPGEKGTLHAWVLRPKNPLPKENTVVMVEAFYGGDRHFSMEYQILCQAGITIVSPAPRGSWGWGEEFRRPIQGDFGGNETLDIFAAGRWAEKNLGIPAKRIGPFGGSHGGYETMRLVTFPGTVNGQTETFRWGFGVADYGMSDLVRFYTETNIPGWIADYTGGDPRLNCEKWLDRSPLTHADNLHGPLLLTHGSADNRVPVIESRSMAERLKALGKPHHYEEIVGEGHGYTTAKGNKQYFQAIFNFLKPIALGK